MAFFFLPLQAQPGWCSCALSTYDTPEKKRKGIGGAPQMQPTWMFSDTTSFFRGVCNHFLSSPWALCVFRMATSCSSRPERTRWPRFIRHRQQARRSLSASLTSSLSSSRLFSHLFSHIFALLFSLLFTSSPTWPHPRDGVSALPVPLLFPGPCPCQIAAPLCARVLHQTFVSFPFF